MFSPTSPLSRLAPEQRGTIRSVDWSALSEPETRRLREFGIDEGVTVEMVHRSSLGGGPIACRIGRMTVALRRRVADAVHVAPAA